MDQELEKYLRRIHSYDVEEYSSYEYLPGDELEGSRSKKFVRMSGEQFEDLFYELRNNPNCSFDTYINDIIRSGYNPQFVSVLMKNINDFKLDKHRYNLSFFTEVIASKVLNFFECPTTYEMFSCFSDNNKKFCCSVDFAKQGEDFFIIEGMGGIKTTADGERVDICEQIIDIIVKKFRNCKMKEIDDELFEKMLNNFKEDYVYSWLIRFLVMNDRDFDLYNVGLIYNGEENTIRMAPNFDMEMCFTRLNLDVEIPENISSLQYIANKYPQVLKKFEIKLQEFRNEINGKSKIRNIVENVIGNENKNVEQLITDLQKRVERINNFIQDFLLNKEGL